MAWLAALALGACAAPPPSTAPAVRPPQASAATPSPLRPYPDHGGFISCVPFARAVAGIDIHGDAWTWWDQAAGHYARGDRPAVGAVLTLKRTRSLPLGHVAVVAEVLGPRKIMVTHANWGSNGKTRGVIHKRQPAVDVSPANDWSAIRFMNTEGSFGRVYPAAGFIYQKPDEARSANLR